MLLWFESFLPQTFHKVYVSLRLGYSIAYLMSLLEDLIGFNSTHFSKTWLLILTASRLLSLDSSTTIHSVSPAILYLSLFLKPHSQSHQQILLAETSKYILTLTTSTCCYYLRQAAIVSHLDNSNCLRLAFPFLLLFPYCLQHPNEPLKM